MIGPIIRGQAGLNDVQMSKPEAAERRMSSPSRIKIDRSGPRCAAMNVKQQPDAGFDQWSPQSVLEVQMKGQTRLRSPASGRHHPRNLGRERDFR